jgi:hypothetical protein
VHGGVIALQSKYPSLSFGLHMFDSRFCSCASPLEEGMYFETHHTSGRFCHMGTITKSLKWGIHLVLVLLNLMCPNVILCLELWGQWSSILIRYWRHSQVTTHYHLHSIENLGLRKNVEVFGGYHIFNETN